MDSFREISVSSQENTDRDDQPLYQDSSLSISESSLLVMAVAVRHKLSGVALEDLLELIHLHCPKPNKCITEMKEFQLFFQALKHPIVKHYYCPNIVCKVYIGTSESESGTKCAVCATTLCHSAYFIEIPVMEQLRTILSRMFITVHFVLFSVRVLILWSKVYDIISFLKLEILNLCLSNQVILKDHRALK